MISELISQNDINRRIDAVAIEISKKCPKDILVIGLLKGCFVFAADLIRAMDRVGMTPNIDFIRLSSYGSSKKSSGKVLLSGDIPVNIKGRDILIVDDILDSGRSLSYACDLFKDHGANNVKSCILLDKPARREVDIAADFIGFEIENLFVVGYGIDYDEKYRHLPYIAMVD